MDKRLIWSSPRWRRRDALPRRNSLLTRPKLCVKMYAYRQQAYSVIRKIFYLTKLQVEKLQLLSAETGLSIAEHVRRAIDMYLKELGR